MPKPFSKYGFLTNIRLNSSGNIWLLSTQEQPHYHSLEEANFRIIVFLGESVDVRTTNRNRHIPHPYKSAAIVLYIGLTIKVSSTTLSQPPPDSVA